jgi:hypothetical protein
MRHTLSRRRYSSISKSLNNDYSVHVAGRAERGSSCCRLDSAVLDWRINVWSWKQCGDE